MIGKLLFLELIAAMVKHSWPTAVTSWEDTVKFAQLVFGTDVRVQNYCDRLPHGSKQSFLLVVKVACQAPRPLSGIVDLIPQQLSEIETYERNTRGNSQNPLKTQQMLSRGKQVYYISCQVTRSPCSCRSVFGADAHHACIPTASSLWNAGDKFAKLFDATLHRNFQAFGTAVEPVWFRKSWQVVWNLNDDNQNHGIEPHADVCRTYSPGDPITSFSFGRGGVLTLSAAKKKTCGKMLLQEDGDALIMAGNFQNEFWHGVPARETWEALCQSSMFISMQEWEQKQGMLSEVQRHKTCGRSEKDLRFNCTLRWKNTQFYGCPEYKPAYIDISKSAFR